MEEKVNNMGMKSNLQKARAKKDILTITVEGDSFEMPITGMTFDEMTIMAEYADKKDNKKALRSILFSAFRKALPKEDIIEDGKIIEEGATDDEINNIIDNLDSDIANKIIIKVQDLSGIEAPKKNHVGD